MIYNGIMSNLFGKDREEAMAVIDDDEKFDKWREDFDRRKQAEASASPGKPGRVPIDKETYLAKAEWKPPE